MLHLSIKYRIIFSYLLLTAAALSFLGFYLLDFFYNSNLEKQTENLITNARLIELALESDFNTASPNTAEDKIRQFSAATNLRITLLDSFGNVLADSWETASILDNHRTREEISAALQGETATSIRYSNTIDQNMLYVAVPMRQKDTLTGIVRTASTLQPVEAAYTAIRRAIYSALCITCLLAILTGLWLAHKNTRPILTIVTEAQRIANGDLKRRICLATGDELDLLANAINSLTASLADQIENLDTQSKKLTFILETMDNAVLLLDRYGNITDANRSACSFFQISPDLFGKHSIGVLGDSQLTETAQEVMRLQTNQTIQLTTRLHQVKKTYQVFLSPLIAPSGNSNGVLSVFHDISSLQETYERQVDFVSNASHELKTPLTSIQGFAETLLDGALEDPVLRVKFTRIIGEEAQRMNRLVEDLLLLAKLDSVQYRKQIKIEDIDVSKALKTIVYRLSPQIKIKKQQIHVETPAKPLYIQANYDWLLLVLLNLSENAIKYTPEKGEIFLSARLERNSVQITIKDAGIGIPADCLPYIFERFYRVDKARSRTAGGSGLGLSIVHHVVDLLGGSIHVKSKPGKGSSFILTFPSRQEKSDKLSNHIPIITLDES